MAKKYIPEKMVKISRYSNYIPTLPDDIQRDIISKMQKLIEEEKKYCDDGNYYNGRKYGYNIKSQLLKLLVIFPAASALAAWVCTLF